MLLLSWARCFKLFYLLQSVWYMRINHLSGSWWVYLLYKTFDGFWFMLLMISGGFKVTPGIIIIGVYNVCSLYVGVINTWSLLNDGPIKFKLLIRLFDGHLKTSVDIYVWGILLISIVCMCWPWDNELVV